MTVVRSVLVRYFAAAEEAAGKGEEQLALPPGADLRMLKVVLIQLYGESMAHVLLNGSFLVDGVVARDDEVVVGSQVDVLPPLSGG